MRIIKFRAWDPKRKEMNNFGTGGMSAASDCLYECESSGWIPMQFTGLTDKNGKDIYEGDIIEDEWNGVKRRNPVKYQSYGFEHEDEGIGFQIEHNKESQQTKRYTVVGNIFEEEV